MRLNQKIKIRRENVLEDIVFERPTVGLDGRTFSCVISSSYSVSDGEYLIVQINRQTPIELLARVTPFVEQGWTILDYKFDLAVPPAHEPSLGEDTEHRIWYYFIGLDGIVESGYNTNKNSQIHIERLGVTNARLSDDNASVIVPMRFYIEDGILHYGDTEFQMETDDNGIASLQTLAKDKTVFIRNGKKHQWKEKKRLTLIIPPDEILPIQDYALGEVQSYVIMDGSEHILSDVWKESTLYPNRYYKERYLISGKTRYAENEDVDAVYPDIYPGVIEADNKTYLVHDRYIEGLRGDVIFLYLDSDSMTNPLTTKYIIAERISSIQYSYYLNEGRKTITVDGLEIEVLSTLMIDYDGLRELNLETVEDSSMKDKVVSITLDDSSVVYFKYIDDEGTRVVSCFQDYTTEYMVMPYEKVFVDNIAYYKEVDTNDEKYPFVVTRRPSYRLVIKEFTEPNVCVCKIDLGDEDGSNRFGNPAATEIHKDLISGFDKYVFKYQEPQFSFDKTDWMSLISAIAYTADIVEFMPDVTITKQIGEVNIPLEVSNIHGTNLFQDLIVREKFCDEHKRKAINSIVDMEKDMYYPAILNDSNGALVLDDATNIRFYVHLRTRNESWQIQEDYINTYKGIYDDNSTVDKDDDSAFVNTSWNILDYYPSSLWARNKSEYKYYQPSDLLSFFNFQDDDIFYQKTKIGKTFLRLSFYDSKNPKTQQLLGTSTVFLDSGKLFGIFSDNMSNPDGTIYYKDPIDESISTDISVSREPVSGNNKSYLFDEEKRLDGTFTVSDKLSTSNSSEGFYLYLFREIIPQSLHEQAIYMRVQLNHAGEGSVIDLIQPIDENGNLIDFSRHEAVEKFKRGATLERLYDMMYIPIMIRYDFDSKKPYWYLPSNLSGLTDNQTIRFNLYEIKIQNYASSTANN